VTGDCEEVVSDTISAEEVESLSVDAEEDMNG